MRRGNNDSHNGRKTASACAGQGAELGFIPMFFLKETTPGAFDRRCWKQAWISPVCVSVCECECVWVWVSARMQCLWLYHFTVPARARHSLLSALVEGGRSVAALEMKTHSRPALDIYSWFIALWWFLLMVVSVRASLHYLILPLFVCNFPWLLVSLPDVTNPQFLAIEAGPVCSRDKAELLSSCLDRQPTWDTDKAAVGLVSDRWHRASG